MSKSTLVKRYLFKNGLKIEIFKGYDHWCASDDNYYLFIGDSINVHVECETLKEAMHCALDQGFGEPIEVHFCRLSNGRLMIYESSDGNGSHIENQDALKTFLENHGFYEFSRGFDTQCGKGTQEFRPK